MTVTRMNLWGLGDDWNPTMLWYARAGRDLQKRPITDATSWTYLAAMHGFDRQLWQGYGYITSTTPLPPTAARRRDWDQCQHQSDLVEGAADFGIVDESRWRRGRTGPVTGWAAHIGCRPWSTAG